MPRDRPAVVVFRFKVRSGLGDRKVSGVPNHTAGTGFGENKICVLRSAHATTPVPDLRFNRPGWEQCHKATEENVWYSPTPYVKMFITQKSKSSKLIRKSRSTGAMNPPPLNPASKNPITTNTMVPNEFLLFSRLPYQCRRNTLAVDHSRRTNYAALRSETRAIFRTIRFNRWKLWNRWNPKRLTPRKR